MRTYYFIRHSQSVANIQKRYAGKEVPLSENGEAYTRESAQRFVSLKECTLYTSEYERAIQTAKIIFPEKEIIVEPLANELDFGDFIGHTIDEIKNIYPDSFEAWRTDPFKSAPPSGESVEELYHRAGRLLSALEERGEDAVIFSHDGFIRAALANAMGDINLYFKFELEHCKINAVKSFDGYMYLSMLNA